MNQIESYIFNDNYLQIRAERKAKGEKAKMSKEAKRVLEISIVVFVTIILFELARRGAYSQRGYSAAGGEFFIFLLPILYYMLLKDVFKGIRKVVRYASNRFSHR